MRPRATVFDSNAERETYTCIRGFWEPTHKVWPHLPFENLIELDPQRLGSSELQFLHKTTVDFVLTTSSSGQPLLGVEFDGLSHGRALEGRYLPGAECLRDPNRASKLDLKCRIAAEGGFPFVVVSYDEKAPISEGIDLTILHGIIGTHLARLYGRSTILRRLEAGASHLEDLSGTEREGYLQDLIIDTEVEADLAWNPIIRETAFRRRAYMKTERFLRCGQSASPPDPRPEEARPYSERYDPDAAVQWWRKRPRHGVTYFVETPLGRIERTAWVRNMDVPGGSAITLAAAIAELLAWHDALALVQSKCH